MECLHNALNTTWARKENMKNEWEFYSTKETPYIDVIDKFFVLNYVMSNEIWEKIMFVTKITQFSQKFNKLSFISSIVSIFFNTFINHISCDALAKGRCYIKTFRWIKVLSFHKYIQLAWG